MNFVELKLKDVLHLLMFLPNKCNFSEQYHFRICNQGNLPNCSSYSWIACIEYLRQINGFPYEHFSALYQYYMSRIEDLKQNKILGVSMESSVSSLLKYGVVPPTYHDEINSEPSNEIIISGRKRIINDNIIAYKLEHNVDVFKAILGSMGIPIVISLKTTKEKLKNRTRTIFKKDENDIEESLHAVCIVGYDDSEQVFIFQNSYGAHWQFEGFGKIHYSYITNIRIAVALNKSCVKGEESSGVAVGDYICIINELIQIYDFLKKFYAKKLK